MQIENQPGESGTNTAGNTHFNTAPFDGNLSIGKNTDEVNEGKTQVRDESREVEVRRTDKDDHPAAITEPDDVRGRGAW